MSATGEVENPVVVQPSTEAPMAQATEKPVKEKKSRVPKQKKPKSAKSVTHPPYFQVFIISYVIFIFLFRFSSIIDYLTCKFQLD